LADDCCSRKHDTIAALAVKAGQRRVLVIVMVINFAMFFVEFGGGLAARSSALMADSVDMLGDGLVYALSLYALYRGARWEAGAAIAKGGLILALGLGRGREWLDWQLKGDKKASRMFRGPDCTLCRDSNGAVQRQKLD
jgi:hypothetical protein